MRQHDPLIIGGGPAGAAAAITLAQGGTQAVILERQRETGDAICGGFISWQTLQTLERMGVSTEALGGQVIDSLLIATPNNFARAALPKPARGVSRHRLDSLLLARAETLGVGIERGVRVRALEAHNTVLLADGATCTSDSLFMATGKYELRGLGRAAPNAGGNPTLGIRLILPPHPQLTRLVGRAVELHLFRGGYAGLQLREDGSANLCLAVRKSRLTEAGGDPRALLQALGMASTLLGERLAFADWTAPLDTIAAIPYGWWATTTTSGQFRLGDQAAVIPSLAGEGNGIALASGTSAARTWLVRGPLGAVDFQRRFARAVQRPVMIALGVRVFAEHPIGGALLARITRIAPICAAMIANATRVSPDRH